MIKRAFLFFLRAICTSSLILLMLQTLKTTETYVGLINIHLLLIELIGCFCFSYNPLLYCCVKYPIVDNMICIRKSDPVEKILHLHQLHQNNFFSLTIIEVRSTVNIISKCIIWMLVT